MHSCTILHQQIYSLSLSLLGASSPVSAPLLCSEALCPSDRAGDGELLRNREGLCDPARLPDLERLCDLEGPCDPTGLPDPDLLRDLDWPRNPAGLLDPERLRDLDASRDPAALPDLERLRDLDGSRDPAGLPDPERLREPEELRDLDRLRDPAGLLDPDGLLEFCLDPEPALPLAILRRFVLFSLPESLSSILSFSSSSEDEPSLDEMMALDTTLRLCLAVRPSSDVFNLRRDLLSCSERPFLFLPRASPSADR